MIEPDHKKNRRILIIDDNRAIHDDFRKILSPGTVAAAALDMAEAELFGRPANAVQKIQYEIDSAYQGQEGVLRVRHALEAGRPYAMAFVDIRMPPGMDGVETTQKIWAVDPEVQIVICTAYADYSWDEMFEKIGNHDGLVILKKPFDTVEALQLAHALTEKWWLHQQSRQKMEELERRVVERTQKLAQSLSLLNATLESTADGIVAVDLAGKVVSYNTKFAANWHFPAGMLDRGDAVEMRAHTARQVKDPAKFLQRIKQLQADPEAEVFDEVELRDGRTFERYIFPQRVDGECVGVVINWRDITERKRAEKSLLLLGSAVEQTRESIIITDAELNLPGPAIVFVNPAFTKMTGYNEAEVIGKTPRILQGPRTERAVLDRLRENLEQGKVFDGEAINYRKDGTEFDLEWQIAPLRDAGGKITHFVAIQHDITERKRVEESLQRSKKRLRDLIDGLGASMLVGLLTPEGVVIEANNPALAAAGLKPEQVLGKPLEDSYWFAYSPDVQRRLREAIARAVRGEASRYDMQIRGTGDRLIDIDFALNPVRDEAGDILYLVPSGSVITERKEAEDLARLSQERYRSLIDNARDAIFTIAPDGTFTSLNPAVEAITGLSLAEWIGKPFAPMVHPDDLPRAGEMFQQILKGELVPTHELRGHPGLKRPPLMEMTLVAQKDGDGKIIGVLGIGRDITARKRFEAQLVQSQKLETVGKLAGGFAHEFNSILTAIIGQSELLFSDLPAGSPLAKNATEITNAANRAAALTRQLLAYGRKQMLRPEILDLNSVLAGLEATLRHLMGPEAVVLLLPATGLRVVKADAGQVEQVILNMVINAADAMPNGGKLILETANLAFDDQSVGRYPELKPGGYVMLAITDTGAGMSDAVKARVFEPFYTTKGVGQGTGLGLSTCYGIIKQSGGHISVYSEPGRGTTFKIYLPQVESEMPPPVRRLDSPDLPRGTETILLVEDDPALREMAAILLRRLGYTVLTAANGLEALSLKQERGTGHIDLLFTDVVMPHMSGKELADRVQALYPQTKILFTSAYTENAIIHQGVLKPGVALLQKPFTPSALAQKIRETLARPQSPGAV